MMQQEKNSGRKKKISRAKKVRSVQEGRICPCQGIPLEQLQVITATSTSETTPITSSAFSPKQILSRNVHKTERSLPSSSRKKAKVIGTLAKKFNLNVAVDNKSVRKKE